MKPKREMISGFSKLDKISKIEKIATFTENPDLFVEEISSFWHYKPNFQRRFDEFSENTLTNYYMPYGISPNFVIDGKIYHVPMVIEESSVVAAASKSAKFWADNGGFQTEIVSTKKIGQVHFEWTGKKEKLAYYMPEIKKYLIHRTNEITANMRQRGGGITDIELVDMTNQMENYYQLKATFETVDSMGANFINSCLEEFAVSLKDFVLENKNFSNDEKDVNIIMSILSNYTPECLVRVWVECDIEKLDTMDEDMTGQEFAEKFVKAVRIAEIDPHRATTHNKGIFNGIDAIALATGNDFRAIEACGHTYAARSGKYTSLTHAEIKDGKFKYTLEIPLALGTVGGLTSLHPLAKKSLELLDNPSAEDLMKITAAVGMANNFGAVKSLTTKGIQIGHMKMHLLNILNHFDANDTEKQQAVAFFKENKVSFKAVENFILEIRGVTVNK